MPGIYRGKRVSTDTVKKKVTFEGMPVHVDRPKGLTVSGVGEDGKPWSRTYQYDYGFIPKTDGGDGDGLDVYLGPDEDRAEDAHWVRQVKKDGTFDEYKVFLGFKSRSDAKKAYKQHGPPYGYGGMVSMRVALMRALLGVTPLEKAASLWGMLYAAVR
jgi:hypothetical protein